MPAPSTAASINDLYYQLNTVWVVVAALMVNFMHGGFGFYEAGTTRRRSTVDTLANNLLVLAVTTVVFWAVGFGLMFGDGPAAVGTRGFFPSLMPGTEALFPSTASRHVPLVVFFAFVLSFADTPATIVAGSGAERLKFFGFAFYTAILSGLLFPLLGRAVWGGGYLATMSTPFYDTGSGVVQLSGGLCALAAIYFAGPRAKRFNADGTANKMPSSSLPLVFLGIFILWLGFLAFNAGLAMTASRSIGLVVVNTVLASGFGVAGALTVVMIQRRTASLRAMSVGMLTATVAVTSSSGVVAPWAAALIGTIAGAAAPLSISLWPKLKLDDATEYLTINLTGGAWGVLAVGLFASPAVVTQFGAAPVVKAGLFYGGGAQLLSQLVGLGAITAFCLLIAVPICAAMSALGALRISPEEEAQGADRFTHGEEAYAGFAWDETDFESNHEGTPGEDKNP